MGQFLITTGGQMGSAFLTSTLNQAVSNLFAPDVEGPRLSELSLQTSTEGAFIPIVYGRMRLSGQVIWLGPVKERAQTRASGGGKGGGPEITEYSYSASFAVGLCEGEISGVGRIWANGELLDTGAVVMRLQTGAMDQAPDPLIEAVEGVAPAYRGLAYLVFEDFPLDLYGARLPNLSVEVIRAEPDPEPHALERIVEGVCLIPASGEFAYGAEPVFRTLGEGRDRPENVHMSRAVTDIEAALDDLQLRLPHVRSVALVTAWFGDDLRLSHCRLRPGVESRDKQTWPQVWRAGGLDRSGAHLVSQREGAPAYGGTPSDHTLIAAIRALKARGYAVTLYPFILMDVPSGNGLPDPWGGAEQAAYPWRGRISCHPAPGEPTSPDQTPGAAQQVAAFFGTARARDFDITSEAVRFKGGEDWGFARYILHHAAIAKAAGGVESFIIGSEMRGLTTVRSSRTDYPAVSQLKALASEVRDLMGPDVKLSYAADWSEYFGHAPTDGRGDRFFHLDPLWSDDQIDFIGIDWYGPLADWREGEAHADAAAGTIYDRAYLSANVTGGEGADWYYASLADRDAQIRTPIQDTAHGEDWIWGYKDLPAWWSSPHHDRIAGVRQAAATDWVPQSKPIRLVELGCPAVDKGANQPNVFLDPKSFESVVPYFSTGARDDLIQRRYIEALLAYWAPEAGHNPVSEVYGGPMLDTGHSHVWTWDARPFPEFPAREDVWSDGDNWRRGHWLTGRAGQSGLGFVVADIARRAGLSDLDVSGLDGVLAGYLIDRPQRARDWIAALGGLFDFRVVDRSQGAACLPLAPVSAPIHVRSESLVADERGVQINRRSQDDTPAEARLTLIADDGDYSPASVSARGLDHVQDGVLDVRAPVLADREQAAQWAQRLLTNVQAETETAACQTPPSLARLEPGDAIALVDRDAQIWRVDALDGVAARQLTAGRSTRGGGVVAGPEPRLAETEQRPSRPLLRVLDLPLGPDDGARRGGVWAVGWSAPWPGALVLSMGADPALAQTRAEISAPGFTGVLTRALPRGAEGRWDRAHVLHVRLRDGAVSSASPVAVLGGANRVAVETANGWEVLAFTQAELAPDGIWRLSGLLRGLGGSDPEGAPGGAELVVLDGAGVIAPVRDEERGVPLQISAIPVGLARTDPAVRSVQMVYEGRDLRPLSPVHLRVRREGAGWRCSWIRRTRIGGDDWAAREVPLGEAVEAYEVEVRDAQGRSVWRQTVNAPTVWIPGDIAPSGAAYELAVAQISETVGAGAVAIKAL